MAQNCSYSCLLANLLHGLPVVCGLWVKRLRFDPLNKALSRQCLLTGCFWSCLFQIMVISVPLVDGSNRAAVAGFGDAQFLQEQLHPGKGVLGTAVG